MAPNPESAEDFARAVDPVREWAPEVTELPVVHDFDEEHAGDGAVLLRPLELELAPAAGPDRRYISSAELTLDLLVTTVGLPGLRGRRHHERARAVGRGRRRVADGCRGPEPRALARAGPPARARPSSSGCPCGACWSARRRRSSGSRCAPCRRTCASSSAGSSPPTAVRSPPRASPSPTRARAVDVRPPRKVPPSRRHRRGRSAHPERHAPAAHPSPLTVDAPPVDAGGDLGDLTLPVPESV